MKIPKKGQRFGGRQKGTQNMVTRELKEAIILAAETSKHSKTKDLVGYVKYLADSKPEIFASLLGRLLPLQGKVQFEGTVEHTIKAKAETAMTQEELAEYYNHLRALPASTKPLVIIDNDTGEPLYSKAAD
ncbi:MULTISPECIES: hypothetical protein [unclassified Bradyrhizobium]|uniref:hypothetical protein n=1 Tax=unclassified Bradyrhizobium TaxID=2631580 RepID=UPI001FF9F22A|nr:MULTISPECIES: hypothetical protein [unclassified Bradyrhizobium]MCK1305261.1 hypothetical protein [Bradyrhizobium sp. 45]MCK1433893.1 hypothetical protein [Bradyrhizobium sp. 15]MCK1586906.1 hypothetical protein [Bradyrhizobium sp. 169]MCK1608609.1 hypothetical protein [Bradyrhizobium sp. 163]MCK1762585.1 hypothetical protein [Bradyrhizobium sp. 136]